MTPAEVLAAARAIGVTLWAEGDALRYRGPREALTADLLDQLRAHKAAILEALARPDPSGVSGEFIPARPDPSAPLPAVEPAILEEIDDPDCPGIDPAELEAGIDAAIVRDLFVRPEHLAALKADPLWWRVSILEPGGRTVEVDAPSGWTLPDWQAYAVRYHGPGCTLEPIAGLPKPRAPVHLEEALAAACEGAEGITPAVFRALLSAEDVADIEGGAIHSKTLHAYAESFAEGMRSGRIVVPGGEP